MGRIFVRDFGPVFAYETRRPYFRTFLPRGKAVPRIGRTGRIDHRQAHHHGPTGKPSAKASLVRCEIHFHAYHGPGKETGDVAPASNRDK